MIVFRPALLAVLMAASGLAVRPVGNLQAADFDEAVRPSMVAFQIDGQRLEGLRLLDIPARRAILGRDGWLHDTARQSRPEDLRPIASAFVPATAKQMSRALQAEFGPRFEVLRTTHYVVVQPRGRGERFARQFERRYRGFTRYMNRCGVPTRRGRFPLVAIVMPDEAAMYAELRRLDIDISGVAGIYDWASNRIIMHDQGNADYIAETVRHESAHQVAFNSGVHSRVSQTPCWLVEGIGCLFEPASMEPLASDKGFTARLHHGFVRQIRKNYPDRQRLTEDLAELLVNDDAFRDPKSAVEAYGLSWAVVFYLAEQRRTSFAAIVKCAAAQPPFESYPAAARRADFEQAVGQSLPAFASALHQFFQDLKPHSPAARVRR